MLNIQDAAKKRLSKFNSQAPGVGLGMGAANPMGAPRALGSPGIQQAGFSETPTNNSPLSIQNILGMLQQNSAGQQPLQTGVQVDPNISSFAPAKVPTVIGNAPSNNSPAPGARITQLLGNKFGQQRTPTPRR